MATLMFNCKLLRRALAAARSLVLEPIFVFSAGELSLYSPDPNAGIYVSCKLASDECDGPCSSSSDSNTCGSGHVAPAQLNLRPIVAYLRKASEDEDKDAVVKIEVPAEGRTMRLKITKECGEQRREPYLITVWRYPVFGFDLGSHQVRVRDRDIRCDDATSVTVDSKEFVWAVRHLAEDWHDKLKSDARRKYHVGISLSVEGLGFFIAKKKKAPRFSAGGGYSHLINKLQLLDWNVRLQVFFTLELALLLEFLTAAKNADSVTICAAPHVPPRLKFGIGKYVVFCDLLDADPVLRIDVVMECNG